MKQLKTCVAIIGAGTAGLSAYRAVKAAGLDALLIEGGPYGTTCARVGCMPSKLLIAAAEVAHSAESAHAFGVRVSGVQVDGVAVMDRVRRERDRFVGFVLDSVDSIPEKDKLAGYARFVSDTRLIVGGHTCVDVERVVIAAGSTPVMPAMYAALGDRAIVNDDVFEWMDLPGSVLIVGTGVIGLEIGQALARLGVRVRFINRTMSVGGLTDPLVKANALAAFKEELDLCLEAAILDIRREGDRVHVRFTSADGGEQPETFDYVLIAAGRLPNLSGLGLQNTSARLLDNGMPEYDASTLKLGTLPIFVAGDVNGVLPVLHEAADDGHIAGSNAASYPEVTVIARRAPMSVVFTDPQLAQVGARFKDLPEQAIICGEVNFANQGRSRVMLKNRGMLRVYARRSAGRFLGAEMAGPAMEHIAHLLAWALQQELTIDQMLQMPFYHPVVEEGLRTALRLAEMRRTSQRAVPCQMVTMASSLGSVLLSGQVETNTVKA